MKLSISMIMLVALRCRPNDIAFWGNDTLNCRAAVQESIVLAVVLANSYWGVGIGAGRLLSANVPLLMGTGALRTRGRVAGVVEVQGRLTRLRYDLVTAEWLQFEQNREIARERNHDWYGTFAIRFRVEIRLR